MRKLTAGVAALLTIGLGVVGLHSAAAATGDFDLAAPQTLATDLEVPWGLAFLPDGTGLVSERNTSRILKVTTDGTVTPLLTLPGPVYDFEAGLLGIAVSPSYATDNYVYAFYQSSTDDRIVR